MRTIDQGDYYAATSASVADGARVALVPVGSTEQHGPHLPLGTDLILARAVCGGIVSRLPSVRLGPEVRLGCSDHHMGFPGTVTLRTTTFIGLLVDVCTSLTKCGLHPIIVNGHGGNAAPIDVALVDLARYGVHAHAFTYWMALADVVSARLGADAATSCGHAGALETAMMQYLHPDLVRGEEIPAGGTPETWPDPHMFSQDLVRVWRPFDAIRPIGVIGRPSLATPELGRSFYEAAVDAGECQVQHILDGLT